MKLIDKAALAANIEVRYNECLKRAKIVDAEYWNGKVDAYCAVLAALDTFEVKEEPVNDKLHEFEKEFFNIVNPYRNSHNYKGICVNLINWQHNLWRWLYWKENKKEPVSEDLEEAR